MRREKYPEELVGILLQAALAVCGSPGTYIISPLSKRKESGWDAKVDLDIYPFYMQFKSPSVHYGRQSKLTKERDAAKARNEVPLLYFYLREKAKTKKINQHNALLKMSKKNKAAYVCPLFISESLYQASIQRTIADVVQAWLHGIPYFHWHFEPVLVLNPNARPSRFQDIPIFNEHVSIPPSKKLEDPEKHRYSFTSRGEDICFHSPELSEDGKLLGYWLQEIYEASGSSFSCKDGDRLRDLTSQLEELELDFSVPDDVNIGTWIDFGNKLEMSFGISQFAIVRPSSKKNG